ncbi:anaphase-promoting complex subunit 5 [Winogradskyella wandonensis]|uniref:Anaphase-promoting complex subunit 5 n=1 Tax=Winogradskyella wandonensis TaxID=1442586 RepID=A0A4R1KVQ9_9FLAO|nr:tetratricopeptide repeat protein [Winogradskyella wandonensis]TCK69265.1 anaphase-promoting complex subunit 5 [Winogradskyella wandonensis]
MRTLIISIALLLVAEVSSSQQSQLIDSLKLELKNRKEDDSIKVLILTKLHEKLMFSKPEEAKQYALQTLAISKKNNYKRGLGIGNMHLGNYHSNRGENDSALYYFTEAKSIFKETKSTRGIIFINHSISSIKQTNGEFDEAIAITKETLKAIEKFEKDGDLKTKFIGAQHNSLAGIYIEKGNYNLALSEALKAIKYFEEINHKSRKADVLKQIGDIETALGNYESSISYFQEAIDLYKELDDKMYLAYAHNSLGISYQELKRYDDAKTQYNLGLENSRAVENKLSTSNALHNLGELELLKKNYKKAKDLFFEAKDISESENLKLSLVNAYQGLSQVDYHLNKFSSALDYNQKALDMSKSINALPHLKDTYQLHSDILLKSGNSNEAIKYLKEAQKINDSLYTLKKSRQIEELKAIYETEKKEAELVIKNREIESLTVKAKNDKLTKSLYGIGMFSFLTIAGLLYFGFKQRIKKNRIAREKQEAIYKQEIEFKKKELASQTLHLVQKNSFIQELKENLEKIKKSPELFKVEFRRLVMLLKKESAEDKDWEVFKSYFSEVHNNFDIKIKEISNDISEKEIRLASFLRMNLTTKEIASMLNVQPDSVKKSKYRLKTKLSLGKDDDLTQFLNSI